MLAAIKKMFTTISAMMTGNKETRKVVSKTFFIFKQQSFENERDLVTTVNVDKLEHHGDGDA